MLHAEVEVFGGEERTAVRRRGEALRDGDAATDEDAFTGRESSAGRGPMGGTVRTGMRAVEAAADLVKFGLLRLDNTSTSTLPRNGFTVHTTCACYEITTEGLAAHAALTAQAA